MNGDDSPWSAIGSMSKSIAARRIKELRAELEPMKKDKELLEVTWNDYKLALRNVETMLDLGELGRLAPERELKPIEQLLKCI